MKKYTISILTYKAVEHSKRCIASVIANSKIDECVLYLTANGSNEAEEYFNEVKRNYPDSVVVVKNAENRGFIDPNNEAFAKCETKFFVLLNDDVVINDPQWLQKLEQPFNLYPKAALSGPAGTCQSLNYDFNGHCGPDFEYLEGSMLCVNVEIVKKYGLFSKYLRFAYGEDSDLSLRMRAQGYTLHKVSIGFSHAHSQTSRLIPHIVRENQAYNHVVLKKRWQPYLRFRKMDFRIVIRRMAAHGDVLLVTALLKDLKERWPLCSIAIETQPCMYPLFQGNPYVSNVGNEIKSTWDTWRINLDMSYENKPETHIVDAYAEIAGLKLEKRITEQYAIKEPIKREKNRICVHPGPTTWVGKNWPMDRWNELCKRLRAKGYKVTLVGHGNDIISCDKDLRGATSYERLASELAEAQLFIGVDSFPLHVAQSVRTPVIGLFGVTDPKYILTDGSPWAAACGTHSEFGSRHKVNGRIHIESKGEAMQTITVDEIYNLVQVFNK